MIATIAVIAEKKKIAIIWKPLSRAIAATTIRGTQLQFSENICSEDDLRSRIFETFVLEFLACLPLLGSLNISKNGIIAHF